MFGKKTKANEWYYTAKKAYRKGKIPAPYAALFDYYNAMNLIADNVANGHYDFFWMAASNGTLDAKVRDLRSILPDGLRENFDTAYERYNALGDDPEYEETSAAFDALDDYAFDNFEQLLLLLKDYIEEMEKKHLL